MTSQIKYRVQAYRLLIIKKKHKVEKIKGQKIRVKILTGKLKIRIAENSNQKTNRTGNLLMTALMQMIKRFFKSIHRNQWMDLLFQSMKTRTIEDSSF
jgi:hypothetical protein